MCVQKQEKRSAASRRRGPVRCRTPPRPRPAPLSWHRLRPLTPPLGTRTLTQTGTLRPTAGLTEAQLGEKAASSLREAGDRARTGDPQLGKLMLYQLSYTRGSPLG